MKYTEPRFTKDLDLWIAVDEANATAVFGALQAFGAPLAGLAATDFMDTESFYQMGRPPLRGDVMMSIPGVEFDEAWSRRETVDLNGLVVPFIGKQDLIRAKLAAAREQDLLDARSLQRSNRNESRS